MLVLDGNPFIDLKTLKSPLKVIFKANINNKPKVKKKALVEEKLDNILTQIYNN